MGNEILQTETENKEIENKEEKKLSSIEKLELQIERKKRKLAELKHKESLKAKKERTHRLIERGGLIEIAFGDKGIDKGILLGLLIKNKALIENPNNAQSMELKQIGDKIIAEREARNRNRDKKEVAENADNTGNAVAG